MSTMLASKGSRPAPVLYRRQASCYCVTIESLKLELYLYTELYSNWEYVAKSKQCDCNFWCWNNLTERESTSAWKTCLDTKHVACLISFYKIWQISAKPYWGSPFTNGLVQGSMFEIWREIRTDTRTSGKLQYQMTSIRPEGIFLWLS